MTMVTRYRHDETNPTITAFGRDLILRALLPAFAVIVLGVGVGWVLTGPIGSASVEHPLSVQAQSVRSPSLDAFARTASEMGSVTGNALLCIAGVALLWVLSRRWWLAALPAVALGLHVMVHLATSTLIARPRPLVETLDVGQPTASFPSGHVGATAAQLVVLVLFFCHRVESRGLRALVLGVVAAFVVVLGWSRVYLGMHYVSDVVWGAVNGVACGLIAWLFLRRTTPGEGPEN